MTSQTLDVVKEARSKALGPFSPSMNITEHLYARLNKVSFFLLMIIEIYLGFFIFAGFAQ